MKAISQCLKFIQNVSFQPLISANFKNEIKTLDGVYENVFPFLTMIFSLGIFNNF